LALVGIGVGWRLTHRGQGEFAAEAPPGPAGAAIGPRDRALDHGGAPSCNVVIYLIDTLRADRLGAYGYDKPTSPHLDALAAEGIVFEQCQAPAPWTLPSVVSLLTSTFPCEHGVLRDGERIGEALDPLAVRLQRAGYATAAFVANPYAGAMSGLDRGYDQSGREQIIRRTEEGSVRPLHLYIHTIEPHEPPRAPDRLVRLFGNVSSETKQAIARDLRVYRRLTRVDFDAGSPVGTTDNTADQDAALRALADHKSDLLVLYDAAVRRADENLGAMIQLLRDRGQWDNTLFLVTADHGDEFGEHGGWQHDQSVYEELLRVPLIVRLPGGRFAGLRVTDPVSLVDVVPTILDYLNRPDLAEGCRGRSLMPLITGNRLPPADEPLVTAVRMNRKKFYRPWRQSRGDVNVVLRQRDHKGIWNAEIETFELYDLASDPGETRNLATAQPELASTMVEYARRWLADCGRQATTTAPTDRENLDPETLERLRSLGYVE